MTPSPESLLRTITAAQRESPSPAMAAALTFLLAGQRSDGAWGLLLSLPADLHQSAVAVDALRSVGGEQVVEAISSCSRRFTSSLIPDNRECRLEDYVDALTVLDLEDEIAKEQVRLLLARVRKEYASCLDQDRLPVVTHARVLLTLASFGLAGTTEFKRGVTRLLEAQRSDGAWGVTSAGGPSPLSTALACRAIRVAPGDSARESFRRGISHLLTVSDESDWLQVGSGRDSYAIAAVLRTLGEAAEVRPEPLMEGTQALLTLQNPDGGWGAGYGAPSTVENTACSLAALATAEGRNVVPSRLVEATLLLVGAEVARLESELLQLRERNGARRVLDDQGGRHDSYIKQGSSAEGTSESLQELVDATTKVVQRERLLSTAALAAVVASLVSFATVLYDFSGSSRNTILVLGGVLGSFVAFLTARLTERVVRRRGEGALRVRQTGRLTTRLRVLQDSFYELTESLGGERRTELVYLLYENFMDVPPDVAERSAYSLGFRLRMPPATARAFASWSAEVASLDRRDKALLLEALRQGVQ